MTISASGVRIQGDDYQHLFAWYHALRLLDSSAGVTSIEVEAKGAGNVDDVVVRRSNAPDEYYQVKYSVDASNPINNDWFLKASTKGGTSPLQKFWTSWTLLKQGTAMPLLSLFTNRPLDVGDPLLKLRDGLHGRLMPRAGDVKPRSNAGKRRTAWATHLKTTEAALLEMLSNLNLQTDQGAHSMLAENVSNRMAAMQLQCDDRAVAQGVDAARSWVTGAVQSVDRNMILAEIERRQLRSGARRATFVVQAIDVWPMADAATASVNWVDLFEGNDPRERRQLRDPSLWNGRIRDELRASEERIRGMGFNRLLVQGHMRLSLWFAVGAQFADVRGYHVSCVQRGEPWSSDVAASACELQIERQDIAAGGDLVLALSVTNPVSTEVHSYMKSAGLAVGRFVHAAISPKPGGEALRDAAQAKAWALNVLRLVRDEVRETQAKQVHLFLSGPGAAALLLGHIWNRVPATQLYEDLNPSYAPTIAIPA